MILELLAGRFVDLNAALLVVFGVVLEVDPLAGGGALVGDFPDGPADQYDVGGQVDVAEAERDEFASAQTGFDREQHRHLVARRQLEQESVRTGRP